LRRAWSMRNAAACTRQPCERSARGFARSGPGFEPAAARLRGRARWVAACGRPLHRPSGAAALVQFLIDERSNSSAALGSPCWARSEDVRDVAHGADPITQGENVECRKKPEIRIAKGEQQAGVGIQASDLVIRIPPDLRSASICDGPRSARALARADYSSRIMVCRFCGC